MSRFSFSVCVSIYMPQHTLSRRDPFALSPELPEHWCIASTVQVDGTLISYLLCDRGGRETPQYSLQNIHTCRMLCNGKPQDWAFVISKLEKCMNKMYKTRKGSCLLRLQAKQLGDKPHKVQREREFLSLPQRPGTVGSSQTPRVHPSSLHVQYGWCRQCNENCSILVACIWVQI